MGYRKPVLYAAFGMIAGAASVAAVQALLPSPAAAPTTTAAALTPPPLQGDAAVVTGPRSAGKIQGPKLQGPRSETAPAAEADATLTLAHAGPKDLVPEPPARPASRSEVLTVRRGDTLMEMLVDAGIDRTEAHASIEALRKVWDPRGLRPGDEITVTFASDRQSDEAFQGFSLEPDPARKVFTARNDEGGFSATEVKAALTDQTLRFEGTIDSSLYLAATEAGVSPQALATVIQAFSYDVDFQRDIQPGDRFEVMVERRVAPNGARVGEPKVTFAALTLSGKRLPIYLYTDSEGNTDYYDDKGRGVRKALLRTPINGARLSSGYGKRKHPVLGYTKMHKGIDFAAPTGTPVFAAGDGVIEKAGRWGGYGNYIRIRHNSTFHTAYAHLSRYAKGIKPGKRVKQGDVIAYVGSTGRSTGPHLHYEILKKGAHVNPLKVRFPAGRELEGKELKRYLAARAEIDRVYAALPRNETVAQAEETDAATR